MWEIRRLQGQVDRSVVSDSHDLGPVVPHGRVDGVDGGGGHQLDYHYLGVVAVVEEFVVVVVMVVLVVVNHHR